MIVTVKGRDFEAQVVNPQGVAVDPNMDSPYTKGIVDSMINALIVGDGQNIRMEYASTDTGAIWSFYVEVK